MFYFQNCTPIFEKMSIKNKKNMISFSLYLLVKNNYFPLSALLLLFHLRKISSDNKHKENK